MNFPASCHTVLIFPNRHSICLKTMIMHTKEAIDKYNPGRISSQKFSRGCIIIISPHYHIILLSTLQNTSQMSDKGSVSIFQTEQ